MIIGNFKYERKSDTYAGFVTTLTVRSSSLQLKPVKKGSDKEPDYRIFGVAECEDFEVGAAWKRKSDKGQEFLSVVIDDPAWERPLNAALFTDGPDAQLVWSRSTKKKEKAE